MTIVLKVPSKNPSSPQPLAIIHTSEGLASDEKKTNAKRLEVQKISV
jgi:hypothetical protein